MNQKKINLKLLVPVLLLALLLPVFGNLVTSQASENKEKVLEFANKYKLSVDENSLQIDISNELEVYMNSYDAKEKKNAVTKYSPGKYYIFRIANDSVNISKRPNSAGGWVNALSIKTNSKTTENNKVDGNKFYLAKSTNVYLSSDDAINGKNPVRKYDAGTYYIFSKYGNAINISRVENKPGGWIKLTNEVSSQSTETKKTENKTTETVNKVDETKKEQNTVTLAVGNKVTIKANTKIYITADDAINGKNSVGTRSASEYYIYKIFGDAVNISKTKNSPDSWVSKSSLDIKQDSASKTQEPVKTVEVNPVKVVSPSTTGSSNNFVLYLDPGHGPGAEYNRGGLLFNEGDQNFKFVQAIIKASQKYQNLVVKTTRSSNDQDPGLYERGKMASGSDLFISLHTNASLSSVRGVELWASNQNNSQNFANELTKAWSSVLGTYNRGVKYMNSNGSFSSVPNRNSEDYWGVFRGNTAKEKFILESVFHTNIQDSMAYLSNQDVLANKLLEIVAKYYNLKLK